MVIFSPKKRKSPQSIHNVDKLLTILNDSIQYDPNYYGDDDDDEDEEQGSTQ